MEQKLSRYQNIIVLLITLLLHAGIILSIIIMKFDHPLSEAMVVLAQDSEPEQYQTPQNDWVTTSQALATPSSSAKATQASPKAMPGTAADRSSDKPEPQTQEQQAEQEPAPMLNEEQMQNAVSLAQKLLARAEKREVTKKEVKKSEPPEEQLVKQEQPQSPSLTLAQLTQGFMQHLQESPMTVRSQKQGQASMEQLQQMHYMQKIIGCIVNSYKIHNNSSLRGYNMQQARIQLAINKDGTIHTLQLVQSSGNMTIDQFLLTMFQDASSSFPPMPSSFKEQTFYLPLFNVDRLESFQSTNGWYIDNSMP
ncbi:hypothetical protein E3J61_02590 [Candidatus Dependentiae bacterium]|nr:MAG: hypothetical protein E3J61_02590 [Candidatus Dependentiae bacterium]